MKRRINLTAALTLFIFAVMMAAVLIALGLILILNGFGVMDYHQGGGGMGRVLLALLFSLFLGTTISIFLSKRALTPLRTVINATHQVAQGDFHVRVTSKGVRELEELSHSFNKMVAELASTETLRKDFINNFSHEFKTPILSIRGFAKLLQEGNLDESDRTEYLGIIISEADRLASLSTNVLNLSKYENIEILPEKSTFSLDEQIRRTLVILEPKWSEKNLEIDIKLEEITFNGNVDLTQQVWLNLLDNAIKFSEVGGNIQLRLQRWNHGVKFTLKDSGEGMDKETASHIFEKFYQGDTSRSKTGNGLGLAIVKRIIELHNGTIEVESEVGIGTEFKVFLPFS